MTMAIWTSSFLLNRSASLPQIGVVAVAVSRVAVTTQVYWVWLPFSVADDLRQRGRDDGGADHRDEQPSSRPLRASRICRWVM